MARVLSGTSWAARSISFVCSFVSVRIEALEQVMTAASMLQPGLRDRFLRSVAGRLADVRNPDDHAVRTAIEFVLGCYGVSIPHPVRASLSIAGKVAAR